MLSRRSYRVLRVWEDISGTMIAFTSIWFALMVVTTIYALIMMGLQFLFGPVVILHLHLPIFFGMVLLGIFLPLGNSMFSSSYNKLLYVVIGVVGWYKCLYKLSDYMKTGDPGVSMIVFEMTPIFLWCLLIISVILFIGLFIGGVVYIIDRWGNGNAMFNE